MRASARALALLLVSAACAAPAALEDAEIRVLPAEAVLPPSSRLELLSVVELRGDVPAFGGFSALEVSADGERMIALSDRGLRLETGLARRKGRLSGLTDPRLAQLTERKEPLVPVARDAEGLAIPAADLSGPRYASFERLARVARLRDAEIESILAAPEAWSRFPGNTGLEALAAPPGGGLLALQEAPEADEEAGGARGFGAVGAWRVAPHGAVSRLRLPRLADWSVTGADFGPEGHLYVLARRFDVPGGFSFAIWRYDWREGAPAGGEILLELPAGAGADNAEGLAVWREPAGRLRLLVVTDDNFSLLQRTLLYDFAAAGAD
jgi:hypothetical protein